MTRIPLRVKLTLLVTIMFGVALAAASALGLSSMEASLRADTRDNAEALIQDYFDQVQQGSLGPADPAPEAATRFVYIDGQGQDLSPLEYQQLLSSTFATEIDQIPPSWVEIEPTSPDSVSETTMASVSAGAADVLFQSISPDGEPLLLDRGAAVIAVGLPVMIGQTPVTVAVSSPLQPVIDSVNTLKQLLLVLVPVLIVAIAAATWTIVGRALRPVDAITAQVDRIATESLDQRVPEPGTGDELGHLAATMNQMLARLQRARDVQRRFISDASHELRSPITATRATLDVALKFPNDDTWADTVDILQQENMRLADLVDDLLLLAQLDETASIPLGDVVDLDEVCLAEAQRPHPRPVRVHIDSPARVTGSLNHLTRAIRNLVDNATRHATTRVDITVSFDQGSAVVEVVDDGPGVPPDSLELIFDRFSRVEESRNRADGGGAGLGLAITKQIIDAHHGTITVCNQRPAGGANFTLTIPAGDPD